MTAVVTRPGPKRVHRYQPRGSAAELWYRREQMVLVSGPAGTGKSRACLEKLHAACLTMAGTKGLILRKTLASLGSTALETWRKYVIDQHLLTGEVWFYGGSSEEPPQYRYANGSAVVIGGLDKATRIMSSEYDIVYIQEATELVEDDLEMVTTRLRNGVLPFQQLIMDANPNSPIHWLKQKCDSGAVVMLNSTHEENPILFDVKVDADGTIRYTLTKRGRAYMAVLDALTGVRHLRLRKGMWVAAEGVIFEEWNEAVHLVDAGKLWPGTCRPPDNWVRWWVVDFGHTNPFVCQMWAEDPDGNLYMYREIYHSRKTVQVNAQDIMAVVSEPIEDYEPRAGDVASSGRRWTDIKPRGIICDHDANARATLAKELGLGTIPAKKAVDDGINEAQMRFKHNRMFICRDAVVTRDPELVNAKKPTCTVEEIPGYIWEPPSPGRAPKETPHAEDNHGCDCIRYISKHRATGAGRMRWVE